MIVAILQAISIYRKIINWSYHERINLGRGFFSVNRPSVCGIRQNSFVRSMLV